MTLAVENPVTTYSTDGVTFSYPLGFTVSEASDVTAQLTDALGNVSAPGFSVSGGNAVLNVVPPAGLQLKFLRTTAVDQLASFQTGDSFASGVADAAFDRTMRIVQELLAELQGAVRAPYGSVLLPLTAAAMQASGYLAFVAGAPVILPPTGMTVPDGALLTFATIALSAIPIGTDVVRTSGYLASGDGGTGTYISDLLATSALATAHPRFCQMASNGRYFRLLPEKGQIAISQGGALGGTNNDQPAVQAAIDYAKAIGCRILLFDFDTVSLWCPVRTSNAAQTYNGSTVDNFSTDGMSMVVSAPLLMRGLPNMTHIKMLSTTGGSLETGWQNVGGNIWRGPGVQLMGGTQVSPNANNLTFFGMQDIWLDGGCAYTGSRFQPVTPANPDGPDYTNRGLKLQDTQCDQIWLSNVKMGGFKAELYFITGTTQTIQKLRQVELYGSNQTALNPSAGNLDMEDCYVHDSYGIEILGGAGGRISNTKLVNLKTIAVIAGQSGAVPQYNYGYPNRDMTKPAPWFDFVGCQLDNCGQVITGSYVRFRRCSVTDTFFYLITGTAMPGGNGSLTSAYFDIDYTVDLLNQTPIFAIYGPPDLTTLIPGSTTTYIAPVSDFHINVNVHRSANAIANSRITTVASFHGCFDVNSCSISVGEADGIANIVIPNSAVNVPLVTIQGPSGSQNYGNQTPWSALVTTMTSGPYALAPFGPRMALGNTGTAAAIAVTMASTYTYPNGQRCRIWWWYQSTAGTTYTFARNGTGLRLNSDCVLAVKGDWLEVEYASETGLWHECGRQVYAP